MIGEERIDWRLPKVQTEDLKERSVDTYVRKSKMEGKKRKVSPNRQQFEQKYDMA